MSGELSPRPPGRSGQYRAKTRDRDRDRFSGPGMPSEAQWREWAIPVYRALEAAGPAGLTRDELKVEAWIPQYEYLADLVWWMRAHGVDIKFVAATAPGEDSRYVLATTLPEAWSPA